MSDEFKELDALVAERVMRWTVNRSDGRHWHTVAPATGGEHPHLLIGMDCCADKFCGCFMPSRRISDAWKVVERLAGWGFCIYHYSAYSSSGYGYVAVFAQSTRPFSIDIVCLGDPERVTHAHSNSAAEAICKAALLAVEIDERQMANALA